MDKGKKKTKVRNPHAAKAKHGKSGAHKDKRKGRGGAKNKKQEYLMEAEKETEYRLYVDYEEHVVTTEEGDPTDSWDRGTTDTEVTFKGVFRNMDSDAAPFFYDSHVVSKEIYNSQKVALVVVRYNTGDTFGRDNGKWVIEGIYSPEKARDVARDINAKRYDGYKPWEGHFERYVGTDVFTFTVEEEPTHVSYRRTYGY